MKMIPWSRKEDFNDIENIQNAMNRMFNSSLSRWLDDEKGLLESAWSPAIDVHESTNDIVVMADLPGVTKDDIDVSVHGDLLTIKGEKKQEREEKDKDFVRTERFYGSFSKSITLPAEVDVAKVDANYKDGVLKLTLPKKEEAKPKQIQIKVK